MKARRGRRKTRHRHECLWCAGSTGWAVEYGSHCIGSAGLRVDPDQHCAAYTVGLFVAGLRGRGLGREVTGLVLAWAFGVLGAHRIELEVLAGNSRAINARRESAVKPSYIQTAGKTSSSWGCCRPSTRRHGSAQSSTISRIHPITAVDRSGREALVVQCDYFSL